ncbi:MAG: hypothetical protein Ct9H300mP18_05970 [Candidatus Neomarinimicrobiota bacterium]|nr:MAG: hypothetical protein Ct9H300mP18_05970 [Candidatus Neomarinimicrobiota bacterium]
MGFVCPGMPIPIIGQNENAAWGFTNIMIDDMDFFIEKINPNNPNQYKHDNSWKEITIRKETIKLKSGSDTTITVRSTHHGPIITDIHGSLKNSKKQISMTWSGHFMSDELPTLIKMATIKNWDDFSDAVKTFSVPGQNIIYADINGISVGDPLSKFLLEKMQKIYYPAQEKIAHMIGTGLFRLMKCHFYLILKKVLLQLLITKQLMIHSHIIFQTNGHLQVE